MMLRFLHRRIHGRAGGLAGRSLFDLLHRRRAEEPAVHQRHRKAAGCGGHARQCRHQFLFIVGRLAHALAHDQAARHFHRRLRVVTLLKIGRAHV